jgi:hypothetical protein
MRREGSCESNADCKAYLGSGECVHVTGPYMRPGAVCWPMGANPWEIDNVPNSTLVCAKNPADAPRQKRVAAGEACLRDCDCLSAFCDRGTCADSADLGAWNYGKGPCEPAPPHTPIDNILTSLMGDICAGYVCIERRCRSCQSDAECEDGSDEYKCLSLYGLPGKRCGRPNEAELGPARNRMGPPPTPGSAPRMQ